MDTDIGSDIDDALALIYLAARPDCRLLGVSTVTGEAEKRAMMASAIGLPAYTCLSEWNARCDPHAGAMVYAAPTPSVASIGLDVTTQVHMGAAALRERLLGVPIARPVLDFMGARTDPEARVTFHDPLAAAVIFEPGLCHFERGRVEVELDSRRLEGLTYFTADASGNDLVALRADGERFFGHFFDALNADKR